MTLKLSTYMLSETEFPYEECRYFVLSGNQPHQAHDAFFACGSNISSVSKSLQYYSDLSHMCSIHCSTWDLSVALPCCSFRKVVGMQFKVGCMHPQLGVSPEVYIQLYWVTFLYFPHSTIFSIFLSSPKPGTLAQFPYTAMFP